MGPPALIPVSKQHKHGCCTWTEHFNSPPATSPLPSLMIQTSMTWLSLRKEPPKSLLPHSSTIPWPNSPDLHWNWVHQLVLEGYGSITGCWRGYWQVWKDRRHTLGLLSKTWQLRGREGVLWRGDVVSCSRQLRSPDLCPWLLSSVFRQQTGSVHWGPPASVLLVA